MQPRRDPIVDVLEQEKLREVWAQQLERSASLLGFPPAVVETIGYYQRGNHQATPEEFERMMRAAGEQRLQLEEECDDAT